MITLCYAAKGGSGTTLVACGRAIKAAEPALLVDLEGDVPTMLGLDAPRRPGVLDWLESEAPNAHLDDLLTTVTPNCTLLPARAVAAPGVPTVTATPDRWDELFDWLSGWSEHAGGSAIVDAGTSDIPSTFVEQCTHRWLVTRPCYVALQRANALRPRPTGVVLVDEPGHAFTPNDVQTSIGAPIVVTLPWDVQIARSVDAGLLLTGRVPRSLHRAMSRAAA